MAVTTEQIAELKTFFLSANIPPSIQLDASTIQNRVAEQVTEKVNLLETADLSDVIADTFYGKLMEIKRVLETF